MTVCIDSGMIISSIPHTHAASQADVRVTKVKIALKRKIADTAVTGCSKQAAISESLAQLSPLERLHFGNPESQLNRSKGSAT